METQYEKLKEAGIAMDGLYSQPRAYEEDHSAFKNYFKIRLLWLDNEFAEMEEDLENLEEESEEESEEDSESLD